MSADDPRALWHVAALYTFASLPEFMDLRAPLRGMCEMLGVQGTLLLAEEGINGTIAAQSADDLESLLDYLRADPRLSSMDIKRSTATDRPFHRLKVRLKREIVTMGVDDVNPNRVVGTYVEPADWNALIRDPDVTLIDTRNDYEVGLGTFQGALDPKTGSFRDFPDWVEANRDAISTPKIAMFCTGGIRCEKASSWMRENGFDDVYHLKGGILRYLEETPPEDSMWKGDCFVFDNRVAVGHGVAETDVAICYNCRLPVTAREREHPAYEKGVSCAKCVDDLTEERRSRLRERQRQVELAAHKGELHVGRRDA